MDRMSNKVRTDDKTQAYCAGGTGLRHPMTFVWIGYSICEGGSSRNAHWGGGESGGGRGVLRNGTRRTQQMPMEIDPTRTSTLRIHRFSS